MWSPEPLDDADRFAVEDPVPPPRSATRARQGALSPDVTAGGPEAGPAAMDAAMRYLAPAARSCHEVRSFLTRKGWTPPVAAATTHRLVELGILDDRRFAEDAVRNGLLRRHEAPRMVAAALSAKGIPEDVIAEALAEPGSLAAGGRGEPFGPGGEPWEAGTGTSDENGVGQVLAGRQIGFRGLAGAGREMGALRQVGLSQRPGPGPDPVQPALAAGTDRLRVLSGSPASVRRRLGGFLARRGYEPDVIEEVCVRLVPGIAD